MLFSFFLLIISSSVRADIQCNPENSYGYELAYCEASEKLDLIDDVLLKAYAFVITLEDNDRCPPNGFLFSHRRALDNYINYSVSSCKLDGYCEGINSPTACGQASYDADSYCNIGWIEPYSKKINEDGFLSTNGCPVPSSKKLMLEELPDLEPSFNCDLASSKVEKAICSSPKLKLYDKYLSYIYLKGIEGSIKNIKSKQRKWMKYDRCNSDGNGDLVYCLESSYKQRIREIESVFFKRENIDISRVLY